MKHTRQPLENALKTYARAHSDAEMRVALLALHQRLQNVFRAYLERFGYTNLDSDKVKFNELVNMIYAHTPLLGGDHDLVRLLQSLTNTRNNISHDKEEKLTPSGTARDAWQLARLIARFWPTWFDEPCPIQVERSAQPVRQQTAPRARVVQQPTNQTPRTPAPSIPYDPPTALDTPVTHQAPHVIKARGLWSRIWQDDSVPRFQWGRFTRRVIGALILFFLARWCKRAALSTAQWIEPIKYVSLALLLAAAVALAWALLLVGKLIGQLRLKGLLWVLVPLLVLSIAFSTLTADTPLPLYKQTGQSARQVCAALGQGLFGAVQGVYETPGEFGLAYTGRRAPQQFGSRAQERLLTPIPANQPVTPERETPTQRPPGSTGAQTAPPTGTPATLSTGTPAPAGPAASQATQVPTQSLLAARVLEPPDCPHPLARLTAPRVHQVIQNDVMVEGSANIEKLDYYKFEFRREDIEDEWHWAASFYEPVQEGELGVWQVGHLPDGPYTLRLTVVNEQGNYPFPPCDVSVIIQHERVGDP